MTGAIRRALGSRYELVDQIGQGASGVVWRVWDRRDQKPVAAKLLWPHYAHDPEVLTRFVRERTLLTSLHHPNIVGVTDLVVEGDDLAIIMDLVDGPSLATLLTTQPTLAPADAVAYVAVVLDALAYAHSQGILHRDVKPDNILLATPGPHHPADIRLADFGIARLTHDTTTGTETIGTPYYMAPELAAYGKSGPETDVYAAGIVLYQLIAGRTPYAGDGTGTTIALRHLHSAPPRLPVPTPLWTVIDTMLAKNPAHRLTAADTAHTLRALTPQDLGTTPLPAQPQPDQWETAEDELPPKAEVEAILGYQPVTQTVGARLGVETDIRARSPIRPASPPAGPDPVVPDESGQTYVKAVPVPATRSVLVVPSPSRSKKVPVIVGTGVGVLVVTVLVLWLTGVFTGGGPVERGPVTTVAAHVTGNTSPSGLRLDFDARYDETADATRLTVSLSATPASGLTGDVLLDLPPLGDGACPQVTADPPVVVERLKASTDGFTGVCAHKLVGVQVGAGATVRAGLLVGVDLYADGGPPDDYSQWLEAVNRTTSDDLRAITGTSFPLQRVTGLTVDAAPVTLTAVDGTPVPYTVWAQWLGGGTATQVLSSETITGMETTLLLAVTGGTGLAGVGVDVCDAAGKTGIRILARQPVDRCALQVRVGALTAPTTTFPIMMR
jgi:serine/threonine-protein kinase